MALRESQGRNEWARRILAELKYASELSRIKEGAYDGMIDAALSRLEEASEKEGAISRSLVLEIEESLKEISAHAKQFTVTCAGHAHIDMNWMWGWHETVALTLDTFETILDLMDEYPDFCFSQSQAAVYRLVEKYNPEMFERIRQKVKQGQWEITASTWVELDKNMPSGESMARHYLYTKRYLADRFGIDPAELDLDFEPDTFGHSRNVPEILADAGIKYYYHCRGAGDSDPILYRWVAPSGRSVLVYREPEWYNSTITPEMAFYVPAFCSRYGTSMMQVVYGVGDHGGGPTRRDIEMIRAMNEWPIFPNFRFGKLRDFLRHVEAVGKDIPVFEGERNFIFTGCYTSQSRIKMANRFGEARLGEAERFNALSRVLVNDRYDANLFEEAWRSVLFNHFHDILPGSGVIETREYAMGLFQEVMATAISQKKRALRAIASRIDTTRWLPADDFKKSIAEGAGAGFGAERYRLSKPSYGRGTTRVFHLFNPLETARKEVVELVLWDWEGGADRIVVTDAQGNAVRHQVVGSGRDHYWGHNYHRLYIEAEVPPCGYSTYIVKEDQARTYTLKPPVYFPPQPRLEHPDHFVLENDLLRVELDTTTCRIVSMVDKASGKELIDASRGGAGFRLIQEDDRRGMTAWIVGRHMRVRDVHQFPVRVRDVRIAPGALKQWITYEIPFESSRLTVTVSLDAGSDRVELDVNCDWHEIGRRGQGVPQLNFWAPVKYTCKAYRYDVPFAVIEREPMDMDVPANSWGMALDASGSGPSLLLVSDSKYGFRGFGDAIALSLIRSSYDPDPYPEVGICRFRLALSPVDPSTNRAAVLKALAFNHPVDVVSGKRQTGDLPPSGSLLQIASGHAALSAVKAAEDGSGLIVRLYETEGKRGEAELSFAKPLRSAALVDIHEKPLADQSGLSVAGDRLKLTLAPFGVVSVKVEL